MAGFFSLGGTQNKEEEEVEKGDKNNLLLLRNEEIYNNKGGFEIWPQSSSSYHLSNYFAFGVGPSRRNRSEDVSGVWSSFVFVHRDCYLSYLCWCC